MVTNEIAKRNDKSVKLKVFCLQDGNYYVESEEGKICYKVVIGNGVKSCSCGDYSTRIDKDPTFLCKHILAVINGNGNIRHLTVAREEKPRLDERFIKIIDGKEFALYAGLLDLAHQNHLLGIEVELLQYPSKDNGQTAVCRAAIKAAKSGPFIDFGDANPLNCNSKVAKHLIRMASTRAKARALRDMTNVGMTALEELGDNDISEEDAGKARKIRREIRGEAPAVSLPGPVSPKQEKQEGALKDDGKDKEAQPAKKEAGKAGKPGDSGAKPPGAKDTKTSDSQIEKTEAKPSHAQIMAIEKLAERRGMNGRQLVNLFTDKFRKPYQDISADEAKDFIKHLQAA